MLLNPYRFLVALLNALLAENGDVITTESGDTVELE